MTIQIPSIVMALADKVGKTPWSWFVASDHVEIVFTTGEKLRFEKEQMLETLPSGAKAPSKTPLHEITPVVHIPKPKKLSRKP
jgi:hypothetical protein